MKNMSMTLFLFVFVVLETDVCLGEDLNMNISDVPIRCGKQLIRSGRIVGGDDAYDGEFPWMVSISLFGRHFCGGTVIGKQWILTAGHCVQRYGPSRYRVRTGEYKMKQFETHKTEIHMVDRIFLHPNFSKPVRFYNDIALLRVKTNLLYNNYCLPICLPEQQENFSNVTKGIVAGWGYLQESESGGKPADTLQKVTLPIHPYDVCEKWYKDAGKDVELQDMQMCAGYKDGGKDSCQGDSGGPLMVKRKNEQYVQLGVVSAGIGCAEPLLPGLYTRVQAYLPWIRSHIDVS